ASERQSGGQSAEDWVILAGCALPRLRSTLPNESFRIYARGMNSAAIITGASRGIGRGIALELARLRFDLIINYAMNLLPAQETAADCIALAKSLGVHIRAEVCQADIGNAKDRSKLIDFTKEQFGRLDFLVNNAGVAPEVRADILEAGEESFDRLMR